MKLILTAATIFFYSIVSYSYPSLQLDILDGVYNKSTETIEATSNYFALYAELSNPDQVALAENYYLSMALLTPNGSGTSAGKFGSFVVDGKTFNATQDMVYGNPPLESITQADANLFDPNDLARHNIFPAYFTELKFTFSASNNATVYNSQDKAGQGPDEPSNGNMYYQSFNVDLSGLEEGYGIHFDLYSESLRTAINKKTNVTTTDIDIQKFAPFSHDAEGVKRVPEPGILTMFCMGFVLLIGMSIKRKTQ